MGDEIGESEMEKLVPKCGWQRDKGSWVEVISHNVTNNDRRFDHIPTNLNQFQWILPCFNLKRTLHTFKIDYCTSPLMCTYNSWQNRLVKFGVVWNSLCQVLPATENSLSEISGFQGNLDHISTDSNCWNIDLLIEKKSFQSLSSQIPYPAKRRPSTRHTLVTNNTLFHWITSLITENAFYFSS